MRNPRHSRADTPRRPPRRRAPVRRPQPPTEEELLFFQLVWEYLETLPQEGEVAKLTQHARDEGKRLQGLGIDVKAKYGDIRRLTCKFFAKTGLDPEDVVQETVVAILHKNGTRSAYDPKKASFSKYVVMIARNVVANMLGKAKRWGREELTGDDRFLALGDAHDPLAAFEAVEASGLSHDAVERLRQAPDKHAAGRERIRWKEFRG